jgi:hypothetical protein
MAVASGVTRSTRRDSFGDRKNPDPGRRDRVMRDLVIVSDLVATSADSALEGAGHDPRSGQPTRT